MARRSANIQLSSSIGVKIVYLGYLWILRDVDKKCIKKSIKKKKKKNYDLRVTLLHAKQNIKIDVIPPLM